MLRETPTMAREHQQLKELVIVGVPFQPTISSGYILRETPTMAKGTPTTKG
jgi:hypothetical protein